MFAAAFSKKESLKMFVDLLIKACHKNIMKKSSQKFPTKEEVSEYLRTLTTSVTKRELAKAFNISGDQRIAFKQLLTELQSDGVWKKKTRAQKINETKAQRTLEGLDGRKTAVIPFKVLAVSHNVVKAVPLDLSSFTGSIVVAGSPNLRKDQRFLGRVRKTKKNTFEVTVVTVFKDSPGYTAMGVFYMDKNGGKVYPTSKKQTKIYKISAKDKGAAKDGDIVTLSVTQQSGQIEKILGNVHEPKGLSLLSILAMDLPTEFSDEAIKIAQKGKIPNLGDREDLRKYPLVTIDGADARDFDDAVFAEPTEDGWHAIVAIADVAHYVPFNSALDREAYERGNSVYFPDRVLPMLPEALSNELCSLKPNVDRACIAVHIWLNKTGHVTRYKFVRGLMKSQERFTYEDVQAIHNGRKDHGLKPHVETLYDVFQKLKKQRDDRGSLEIDMPENRIIFAENGDIDRIERRERLDSHRVIEELMILANVCAAKALGGENAPCLYRTHGEPSTERVETLVNFLLHVKILAKKQALSSPQDFNKILNAVAGTGQQMMISEMVLRAQKQAIYSPKNDGHFGLGLSHYAHFTSPIRRYSDLIVHRSLIQLLGLGKDGINEKQVEHLGDIAQHITAREKLAVDAEREVMHRYLSLYMLEHEKLNYVARISSVQSFGFFISIDETGVDGLVPMSALTEDFFVHNESQMCLQGRKTGLTYKIGDQVQVLVDEIDVLTGQISFKLRTTSHKKRGK